MICSILFHVSIEVRNVYLKDFYIYRLVMETTQMAMEGAEKVERARMGRAWQCMRCLNEEGK